MRFIVYLTLPIAAYFSAFFRTLFIAIAFGSASFLLWMAFEKLAEWLNIKPAKQWDKDHVRNQIEQLINKMFEYLDDNPESTNGALYKGFHTIMVITLWKAVAEPALELIQLPKLIFRFFKKSKKNIRKKLSRWKVLRQLSHLIKNQAMNGKFPYNLFFIKILYLAYICIKTKWPHAKELDRLHIRQLYKLEEWLESNLTTFKKDTKWISIEAMLAKHTHLLGWLDGEWNKVPKEKVSEMEKLVTARKDWRTILTDRMEVVEEAKDEVDLMLDLYEQCIIVYSVLKQSWLINDPDWDKKETQLNQDINYILGVLISVEVRSKARLLSLKLRKQQIELLEKIIQNSATEPEENKYNELEKQARIIEDELICEFQEKLSEKVINQLLPLLKKTVAQNEEEDYVSDIDYQECLEMLNSIKIKEEVSKNG